MISMDSNGNVTQIEATEAEREAETIKDAFLQKLVNEEDAKIMAWLDKPVVEFIKPGRGATAEIVEAANDIARAGCLIDELRAMSGEPKPQLYAFSGLMFSGKDYVAEKAGLPIIGFADPIYALTEALTGTRDKSVPGIRKMMQYIGQVGWGCVNEQYPWTPERSVFVHSVRQMPGDVHNFDWVEWEQFGKRQDFWVNIMLQRIGVRNLPGYLNSHWEADGMKDLLQTRSQPKRWAVVNARFPHELQPLKEAGFKHYHVMCSDQTRRERMEAKGYTYDRAADIDSSEAMAWGLHSTMPADQCIWNDTQPQLRPMLSVAEFLEKEGLKS